MARSRARKRGITTVAAGASLLVLNGYPSTTTAGASNSFNVTAQDPFGNIATTYVGTVQFTSTDSQAGLPAELHLHDR